MHKHTNKIVIQDFTFREKPDEIAKLKHEIGSDPNLLEAKFVEYFNEELGSRLEDLEEALKKAGGN